MKHDDIISDYCDRIATPIVKRLARALRSDLYSGPLYFDQHGNESSCFDGEAEGLHQFDFSRACAFLRIGSTGTLTRRSTSIPMPKM